MQFKLPKNDPKTVADAEWSLPNIPDNSTALNAYKNLSQYYRKVTSGTSHGMQLKMSAWTLQGMVQQGSQQYVLIKTNAKITRYALGDQLPDTSILTEINNNGITIDSSGKTTTITLHSGQRK